VTPRIEIAIGELVLEGIGTENRFALAAALQAEIARQFGDPMLAARLGRAADVPAIRTSPIQVPAGATAMDIGRAVAQAIGQGMRR
jgi:hypothetical protein